MPATQHLRIGRAVARDRIGDALQQWDVVEFFIDERPLCEWLGIGRDLWHYGTELDAGALYERGLARMLGREPAENQLGSGRLVLYRCHCGSDYCGVISCRLSVEDERVLWQDVSFEDSDGVRGTGNEDLPSLTPVARFVFDRAQYESELTRHVPAPG